MQNNLYIIYGCSGAGKTTLAKNIMANDGELIEYKNQFGTYTVSKNKKYVAVGQYHSNCGGADSIKKTSFYFGMIDFLIKEYPNSTIICEGRLLSTLLNAPLKYFLKYKYENNTNVILVFLYANMQTSYKRVLSRSNKPPKIDGIISKQKTVTRTFKKFQELGEFENIIINTENKTPEQVYNEFNERTNNGK